MRKFWWAMGILVVAAVLSLPPAEADYLLDDLYTNSGKAEQWMVVTGSGATLGDRAGGNVGTAGSKARALKASGDIIPVRERNSVAVINGRSETETFDTADARAIYAMYFVHKGTSGKLTVDFYSPTIPRQGTTPDVLVYPEEGSYQVGKTDKSDAPGVDKKAKRFELLFEKKTSGFGSTRGQFEFLQNPSDTGSQSGIVPFVIANVYDGTAKDKSLQIRAALTNRETQDILVYDAFEWDVEGNTTAGGSQWLLVPVDVYPFYNLDLKQDYRLITEVTNHTAVRYSSERFDNYNYYPGQIQYWKFDLPRLNEYDNLKYARKIYLNEGSHIAPGLITVYSQPYNVAAGDKRALHLKCTDPGSPYYELTLNHRVIFGLDLGTAEGPSQSRKPAPYRVQAFNPRSVNPSFLEDVAQKMHENGHGDQLKIKISEMLHSFFSQYNIQSDYYSGSAISSFAVKRSIPKNLRNTGEEGMLPLHITFNIEKDNLRVASHWDKLMTEWHKTGDVHDLFSQYFSVYLLSRKDGEKDNPEDLIRSLLKKLGGEDVYRDQIKVFMDEERGVITVSFIVMLMDGTRDGTRPTLDIVEDSINSEENKFLIVRDGCQDDEWKLTFYVAESEQTSNTNDEGDDKKDSNSALPSNKGGGGGCSALGSGVLFLALAALGLKLAGGKK